MTTTRTATVVNGNLKLDAPLELPEHSRVKVTVSAVVDDIPHERRMEAARKFFASVEETKFSRGGERLTREQMHERH